MIHFSLSLIVISPMQSIILCISIHLFISWLWDLGLEILFSSLQTSFPSRFVLLIRCSELFIRPKFLGSHCVVSSKCSLVFMTEWFCCLLCLGFTPKVVSGLPSPNSFYHGPAIAPSSLCHLPGGPLPMAHLTWCSRHNACSFSLSEAAC